MSASDRQTTCLVSRGNVLTNIEDLAEYVFAQHTKGIPQHDVRFHCADGGIVQATKQMLGLGSLLFRYLLGSECSCVDNLPVTYDIICPDFNANILEKVLDSIHFGRLDIPSVSVDDIEEINSILETFQIFALFIAEQGIKVSEPARTVIVASDPAHTDMPALDSFKGATVTMQPSTTVKVEEAKASLESVQSNSNANLSQEDFAEQFVHEDEFKTVNEVHTVEEVMETEDSISSVLVDKTSNSHFATSVKSTDENIMSIIRELQPCFSAPVNTNKKTKSNVTETSIINVDDIEVQQPCSSTFVKRIKDNEKGTFNDNEVSIMNVDDHQQITDPQDCNSNDDKILPSHSTSHSHTGQFGGENKHVSQLKCHSRSLKYSRTFSQSGATVSVNKISSSQNDKFQFSRAKDLSGQLSKGSVTITKIIENSTNQNQRVSEQSVEIIQEINNPIKASRSKFMQDANKIKFTCTTCHKTMSNASTLAKHIEVVHDGVKLYHCPICSKGFSNSSNLMYHTNAIHNQAQQEFVCQMCDKRFNKKVSLTKHMSTAHTKHVKCPACGIILTNDLSLRKHTIAEHENRDLSKGICEVCGKQFMSRDNLLLHIITIHEKRRPFKCSLCYKRFTQNTHLSRHMMKDHEK